MDRAKKTLNRAVASVHRLRLPRLRLSPGLLVIPAIVYVGLVFVWPLTRMFVSSFSQTGEPLENFRHILTKSLYTDALLRQFEYSGLATIGCLLFGYPVAYLMRIASRRLLLLLTVLVVVPFFVPLMVRTFGWLVILGRKGPIAQLSEALIGETIRVLYTPLAVQIGMVAILLPFMVLPIYSVMSTIDLNLVRSARVVGASQVTAFLTIFFPLSAPGILSGVVLVFMLGIGFFITPDLLGANSGQVYATLLVNSRRYFSSSPGFSEAMAAILLVATVMTLALVSRIVPLSRIWGYALQNPTPVTPDAAIRPSRRRLDAILPRLSWQAQRQLRDWVDDRLFWPVIRALGRIPTWAVVLPWAVLVLVTIVMSITPIVVAILISFGEDIFLAFPPQRLTLHWYREFMNGYWIDALLTSARVGLFSTLITTFLAGLTSLGLVRANFPGKNALMALLMSPMIIPSVITGIAMYYVFFPYGLVGTIPGLLLAHSLGTLPIVTIIMAANLQSFDIQLEKAARVLGASTIKAFRYVTLPLLRTGIITAAFFAFLGSFEELTLTLFLAGVRIRTLPMRLWEDLHYKLSPILAVVSVVLIVMGILILLLTRTVMWLRRK